jgi:hypothetical protein
MEAEAGSVLGRVWYVGKMVERIALTSRPPVKDWTPYHTAAVRYVHQLS